MTGVDVELLGAPRFRHRGAWRPFASEQRYRLLAYLAYQGDWVGRERLAHLLWPDRPDAAARRNLRKVLHTVRALDLDHPLEGSGGVLRWRVCSDVALFLRDVRRDAWRDATERWRGEPFEGLDGGGSAFGDWLQLERERLRDRWRHAVLERARELSDDGDPHEAGRALRRLLDHDDLDEEALQAWLRVAARNGERRRALQAYDAFADKLARELDLEPAATTRDLATELRRTPAPGTPPAVRPALQRASDRTRFVGRRAELAKLDALLESGARLVTVIGPGGTGKSRLAAEALRRRAADGDAGDVAERAAFVPLDAVTDPTGLAAAIGDALDIPFGGDGEAAARLARGIGERRTLLILDTLEHLLAGAPALSELLDACPGLRLIVTSRARLGLSGERLLPLGGLPVSVDPSVSRTVDGGTGDEANEARSVLSDAAQLFVERARRVDPAFDPEGAPADALASICRTVEGSPLALELAAAWVRTLPLDAIAREIAVNLDFLTQDVRDAPARHRSLRATFEHSWALLTSEEQRVLRDLAVFRGGFTLEGARRVTDAPLPVLASLVDASLLRRGADGRYDRHPLLHDYVREKLEAHPDDHAAARARHARWFLHRLWETSAEGAAATATFEGLDPELENVRAAWRSAVAAGWTPELGRAAEGLRLLFETRARYREGAELLDAAITPDEPDDPERRRALGRLLAARARLDVKLARFDDAAVRATRALETLRGMRDDRGRMLAHATLGAARMSQGDIPRVREHMRRALELAERIGDEERVAAHLHNLGVVEADSGDPQAARRLIERALAQHRARGNVRGMVHSLNSLADLALNAGVPSGDAVDLDYAERLLREGLELTERHRQRSMRPWFVTHLGLVAGARGDGAAARALCADALREVRASGDRSTEAWILLTLARVVLLAPDRDDAEVEPPPAPQLERELWETLRAGLVLCREIDEQPTALALLCCLADLRRRQERTAQADELYELTLAHPAGERSVREHARARLHGRPRGARTLPGLAAVIDAIVAAPP